MGGSVHRRTDIRAERDLRDEIRPETRPHVTLGEVTGLRGSPGDPGAPTSAPNAI